MSPSPDRSTDPSPFAWIFGGTLAVLALGSVTKAIRDRRAQAATSTTSAAGTEDEALSAHPS